MTNEQIKKKLMETMKQRRIDENLNQTELAKATSSSQKQISCYEHSIQMPTIGKFIALCEALELEMVLRTKKENEELFSSGAVN